MLEGVKRFYESKYKLLLIIPLILLIAAIVQIGYQASTTGDFLNKGVSLKGGITISVDRVADVNDLESKLMTDFPGADINVRELSKTGVQVGVMVEASDIDSKELVDSVSSYFEGLKKDEYSVEAMGSSLGQNFFNELFKSLIMAFLFMGLVVFLYFGEDIKYKIIATILTLVSIGMIFYSNSIGFYIASGVLIAGLFFLYFKSSIPSVAVIMAALSDIVITIAIINMTGMKLSTAGIAAFLMLIGYSVDTDILLSTKVLKRKEGTIMDRVYSAMKTGLTMTVTTMAALIVALVFTQSEVLKQIMIILLVGLGVDLISTWIQNVGILRWYLEKKKR